MLLAPRTLLLLVLLDPVLELPPFEAEEVASDDGSGGERTALRPMDA